VLFRSLSRAIPPDHGKLVEFHTTGSTGTPLTACGTELSQFFWGALLLRDHLWHQRDFRGKLASIRTTVEKGLVHGWGPATDAAFETGWCATLNIREDIDTQLRWLAEQDADYLVSHPSNVLALAKRAEELNVALPRLREIRTLGETLPGGLREACRRAWNTKVTDSYSSEEAGTIALQCPAGENYHVQAENLLVEVLDEQDQPCTAGKVGRVLLTTLHNFAMPLIRYDIGDYAEVGAACPCGRGLPVLKRIMGRQRNLVTLPDGSRHWPSFPEKKLSPVAPIKQIQLVQTTLRDIEARVVLARPIQAEAESRLVAALQDCLGYPFSITLRYVDAIARNPVNYKYEDFLSLL
jgi:phenylacetate-CoA ligase